ncbi:hypothetical protein Dimus_032923 [Dionaea muscipula]
MAIIRSLKSILTSHPPTKSRPFFPSLSLSSSTTPLPPFPAPALLSPPPPLHFGVRLLPQAFSLSKLIGFPFHGPLFLSSPPWMLSQSATPLHINGDAILPQKLEALKAKLRFPIRLGFQKAADVNRKIVWLEGEDATIASGGLAESFLNLPNFISLSRLISGPVLGWMIINEWYLPAFVGLAVSGATDWLDGFLARRMGINSVVGSYLDPLADKVLIGCVALAMVENNLLHPGLVGLVVLRDMVLVGGAVYKRASSLCWEWKNWSDFLNLDGTNPERVEPLFISKVNTVLQLALVAGALLQPEFGTPDTLRYMTYLSWLVASTTVGSTVAYGAQYMRNRSMTALKGH